MIIESGILSADNPDLMSAGRLNAIPYNGQLTIQLQADKADATDCFHVTIQKPNGDVPIDRQMVPGTNPAAIGTLDSRQYLETVFQATQGGHFTLNLAQTGSAVVSYRLVLTP